MIQTKLENFEAENTARLFEILNENKDTVLGKQLQLETIKTVEEFRAKVPVTRYPFYKELIERCTNGEQGIMCSQKIEYFATSSGTTGRHKMIPVTKNVVGDIRKVVSPALGIVVQNSLRSVEMKSLARGSMLNPGLNLLHYPTTKGGTRYGPLSQSKNAFRSLLARLQWKMMDSLVAGAPGDLVDQLNHFETAMLLHLLFGLADEEVNRIYMTFGPGLSHFFGLMPTYGEQMLNILQSNRLADFPLFKEHIPAHIQLALEFRLKRSFRSGEQRKKRVEFLREEFNKGFEGIVPRIWQKMEVVTASVSGSFQVHEAMIRYYIGHLPLSGAVYIASEGSLGFQADVDKNTYFLHPATVFYEFIPESEIPNENPATLLYNQLKVGEKYELLITTISGFLRYRVGDVIEVLDSSSSPYLKHVPRIQISYRTGSILDAYGEKTTEIHVVSALQLACEEWNNMNGTSHFSFCEFTCFLQLNESPVRYYIFVEMDFLIQPMNLDVIDAQLRKINGFYDHCRAQNKIGPLKIFIVKSAAFAEFKNLLILEGAAPLQVKIPRLISKPEHVEFLSTRSVANLFN